MIKTHESKKNENQKVSKCGKNKRKQIILFGLMGVFLSSLISVSIFSDNNSTISDSQPSPSLTSIVPSEPQKELVVAEIPINVIFIGFEDRLINETYINDYLAKWVGERWINIGYRLSSWNVGYTGENYTLDFNILKPSWQLYYNLHMQYLYRNYEVIDAPDDCISYDPSAVNKSVYQYSARGTLNWLNNNIDRYYPGTPSDSYCMYIMNLFPGYHSESYHYYYFDKSCVHTKLVNENLTHTWGGDDISNRGLFMDLSGGPMYYGADVDADHPKFISRYNFDNAADIAKFNKDTTFYITDAVEALFVPSFIYQPNLIENVNRIKLIVLDNTTGQQISNNFNYYLDYSKLTAAVKGLNPLCDYPITTIKRNYASYSTPMLDLCIAKMHLSTYRDLLALYMEANHSAEFGVQDNEYVVYIFANDPNVDPDPRNSAIGVTMDDNIILIRGSTFYTYYVIHELGHAMGLNHPFEWINLRWHYLWQQKLFNFVSSPMSYAHHDTDFSTFDILAIARNQAGQYMNLSRYLVYWGNWTMIGNGHNYLSPQMEILLRVILAKMAQVDGCFSDLDYMQARIVAHEVYGLAQQYYELCQSGGYVPISLPFSFNGAGEYSWVMSELPEYINSWNIQVLEINGVNMKYYKQSHQLPEPIGGRYYIYYIGYNYGHFEAGNPVPSNPVSTPITTPFIFGGAGEFYWETDSIPDHISSWELLTLEINGVSLKNQYIHSYNLPAKIGGKYYIHYVGTMYGHFEAF